MATRGQINMINLGLEGLRRHSRSLAQAVNSHVEQISAMAQSWVNNQDTAGTTFLDISNTICESVSLILDKMEDFQAVQGAEGGDGRPLSTQLLSTTDSSSSFTVLESSTLLSSPSSEKPKPAQQHSEQLLAQIINRLDNIENDSVKIKDLEQRLGHMEKERKEVDGETVKEVKDRLDHLEESLKDLPTFSEKVERVERRLQMVLRLDEGVRNLQQETKPYMQKIHGIQEKVSSLVTELQLSKKQPVGFTVQKTCLEKKAITLNESTPVTAFTEILSNIGECYNPSTGEFTAPVDGLYLLSLKHFQNGGGIRELQVVCKRNKAGPGGEREDVVCLTWTCRDGASCTDVGLVYMTAGDRLYVKVVNGGQIWRPSGFSCCLIC